MSTFPAFISISTQTSCKAYLSAVRRQQQIQVSDFCLTSSFQAENGVDGSFTHFKGLRTVTSSLIFFHILPALALEYGWSGLSLLLLS